jgi:UDP-N-acetylmuramoyl-L-alanyl-D-glutamate--2,6-diaminopimelate ligase
MPESLALLAEAIGGRVVGDGSVVVRDATHDSREVAEGTLFIAVRGSTTDGHTHVDEAIRAGAAAVCVDHELSVAVPQLVTADTRAALGPLAAAVWGHPTAALTVVGVTGTNGKTTVTHLLASIARAADRTPGVIGTTGILVGAERTPLPRTTPEATDVQRLAAGLLDRGVDLLAMEVSSHALELGRVDGVEFDVVAFTNLGRDHLDFHGDMESYFEAKATLFERGALAVVNVDDPAGRRLADRHDVAVAVGRDVRAEDVVVTADSATFELVTPSGSAAVSLPIGGRFNVENALVAAGIGHALGWGADVIAAGLGAAAPIPGRFEPVRAGQPFAVIVDYAHTPDGIAAAVGSARDSTDGRVVVVMGAGGDRDRDKRGPMGRAAAAADTLVITSDNPRSEDPLAIIAAVREGALGGRAELRVEPDRAEAIALALAGAEPGDVVLILGKGHESVQELAGRTIPFDDRAVARTWLEASR